MASIQGVYIALFGRPADPLGLAFFNSATNNGANLTAIGDLASTAEYQNRFTGQSTTQIITTIYRSLFNRDPDLAGLTFFATALANGTLSINNIAIAIFDGAQGADITIRDLKVAAANSFTAAIDTVAEINGYTGTAAAASGVAFIATVTTTAPTADQITAAVAAATAQGSVGSTFNLTNNTDNFTGTSADDVFNSAAATLTAADTINGGGGTDRLNFTFDTAATAGALPAANLSNVEAFYIREVGGTAGSYDFGTVAGETQVWNDRSTDNVAFTNIASGTVLGVNGDGSTVLGTTDFTYLAAATASSLTISGGVATGSGNITVTGAGVTSAQITSQLGANSVGTIALAATTKTVNIDANSNLTTTGITGAAITDITVKGTGATSIGTLDAAVTKLDASANSGGVTAVLNALTTLKVTGGAGNDVFTTGAVLGTGSVDAGAGTGDRLIVASTADITATVGAKYTNFEQLQANNNTVVNLDHLTGITSIRINDTNAGNDTTVSNLTAAQAVAITALDLEGAFTVGVKGAATIGQLDSVKITVNDGDTTLNEGNTATAATPTIASVETVEFVAVDKVNIGSLTGVAALTKLILSGAGDQSITTGALAVTANTVVDGSAATGKLTVDATAGTGNGLSITGGSNQDTLTGTAQDDVVNGGAGDDTLAGLAGADTINGDAGKDSITGGAGADTLTGGTEADTFVYTTLTHSLAAAPDKVTDFVAGTDKFDVTTVPTTILQGASYTAAGTGTLGTDIASALAAGGGTLTASTVAAVVTITGTGAGTYLVINNATDGYVAGDDAVVNITGLSGTLTTSDFV